MKIDMYVQIKKTVSEMSATTLITSVTRISNFNRSVQITELIIGPKTFIALI